MPRENKQRGRRADGHKRRREAEDGDIEDDSTIPKRRKTIEGETELPSLETDERDYFEQPDPADEFRESEERPFYGLLDESEQEYFKRADNLLEANQFADQEERTLFLENLYKEAEGKELKMACSQSCSRLLERLITISTPTQLKHLFQQFNGNFLHLVQHRFASHCCETLFIQSATVVTNELLEPPLPITSQDVKTDPTASMENLFLYTIDELSGNLGYLVTDRFASHALRVLLVVLSGQPLDATSHKSLLKSKKKEHLDVVRSEKSKDLALQARTVPESFTSALEKIISDSVAGLETHYLRTLATHQTGNPVLQLLVQLELTRFGKQKAKDANSIIRRLLPDDPIAEGTDSASFVNALLYDPVGSRLLETIISNAPGKMFKALFRELFRERMGTLSRNEIAGYVVIKILDRLSAEDLKVAHDQILTQIPGLAQRGRTAVIRTLVERCHARNVDTKKIRDAIFSCWTDDDGTSFSVRKMLEVPSEVTQDTNGGNASAPPKNHVSEPTPSTALPSDDPTDLAQANAPVKTARGKRAKLHRSASAPESFNTALVLHRSLLAQTMLRVPGPLSDLLFDAISSLDPSTCLHLASTSLLSPVLQSSLTAPHAPLIFRRKLITRFYSHIGALSLDPSGSHVVDAIWAGTLGMAFARERVAEELAENEATLRGSSHGRKVWRNWRMDLYKRRRGDWVKMVRDTVGNDGFLSFPDGVGDAGGGSAGYARSSRTGSRPASRGSAASYKSKGSAASSRSKGSAASANSTGSSGSGVKAKTKLDLARERHARNKAAVSHAVGSSEGGGRNASGANMTTSTRPGKDKAG